jgi:Na+/melibiose symporter-like transporter
MIQVNKRNFYYLLTSRILSVFADSVIFILMLKWVEMNSSLTSSFVSLYIFSYLPAALFAIPLTSWLEKKTLQSTMILSNMIRIILFCILLWDFSAVPLVLIYVVIFIDGLCGIIFFPANQSLLTHLIDHVNEKEKLKATSLFEGSYLAVKIAGHFIATLLIVSGLEIGLLVKFFSCLWVLSSICIWWIRPWVKNNHDDSTNNWLMIKKGYEYLLSKKTLLKVFIIYTLFWCIESSIDLINVVHLNKVLKLGVEKIGILNAFYFIGSLTGSWLVSVFQKLTWKRLFIIPAVIYIVFYIGLLFEVNFYFLCILFIGIGILTSVLHIYIISYIQSNVESTHFARVFGFYQWIIHVSPIIGFLVISFLIETISFQSSIVFSTAVMVIVIIISRFSRAIN